MSLRIDAIRRVIEDKVPQAAVARELGISPNTLAGWKREYLDDPQDSFPGHGRQRPDEAELTRLKRENARLKERHGVGQMCRVLGMGRSTFYAWRTRIPSRRSIEDAMLNSRIRILRTRGTLVLA